MNKKVFAALMVSAIAASSVNAATIVNLSATDTSQASTTLTLSAGTYNVSLIQGVYTAWSAALPNNLWRDFYQYSLDGGATYSYSSPLPTTLDYSSPAAAFAAYSALGPLTFTLSTTTNVVFKTADALSSFGDNAGGVSLSVAAVPEAATWAMMVVGFGSVGFAMRKRRPTTSVTFA